MCPFRRRHCIGFDLPVDIGSLKSVVFTHPSVPNSLQSFQQLSRFFTMVNIFPNWPVVRSVN